jgi:hypothetical protein
LTVSLESRGSCLRLFWFFAPRAPYKVGTN